MYINSTILKHAILLIIGVLLFFSNSYGQLNFNKEKLINKHYCDTFNYQSKFGFIILLVKIDGVEKKLIFDTGADILVLGKDSLINKGNVVAKVLDSDGKPARSTFDVIKEFEIASLKYTDLNAIRIDLPKPLKCISDGLIGNNVIRKSNWKITNDFLIVSKKPFKNKVIKPIDCFYYSTNRLFFKLLIDGKKIDTCLVDFGGSFDINLPFKYYDEFNRTLVKRNKVIKKISSTWGINGKAKSDTSIVVNCQINFCGYILDSVNVVFSQRNNESKIGVLLLNRFKSVCIDNSSLKIYFELPINPAIESFQNFPVSVDLENDYFIVDSKILSDVNNWDINIGDKIKNINGKVTSDFKTYCDFWEWKQSLKKSSVIIITTKENKVIELPNKP